MANRRDQRTGAMLCDARPGGESFCRGRSRERGKTKKSMEHAPYERLKWRVLRYAGALPSEKRAQEMTDADYLYCLVHEMCSSGRCFRC